MSENENRPDENGPASAAIVAMPAVAAEAGTKGVVSAEAGAKGVVPDLSTTPITKIIGMMPPWQFKAVLGGLLTVLAAVAVGSYWLSAVLHSRPEAPRSTPPDSAPIGDATQRRELVVGVSVSGNGLPTDAVALYRDGLILPGNRYLESIQADFRLRVEVAPTYEALIDGLFDGTIDIASIPPVLWLSVEPGRKKQLAVIAQKQRDSTEHYGAIFIVKSDCSQASSVEALAKLIVSGDAELTLSTDNLSASTSVVPYIALQEQGVDFGRTVFARTSRRAMIDEVMKGGCTIGVFDRPEWTKLRHMDLVGIDVGVQIPYDPIVVSPTVALSLGSSKLSTLVAAVTSRSGFARKIDEWRYPAFVNYVSSGVVGDAGRVALPEPALELGVWKGKSGSVKVRLFRIDHDRGPAGKYSGKEIDVGTALLSLNTNNTGDLSNVVLDTSAKPQVTATKGLHVLPL